MGLALGVGGVYGAGLRYPAFRQLTLPLRAFLCTSSMTFGGEWFSSLEDMNSYVWWNYVKRKTHNWPAERK